MSNRSFYVYALFRPWDGTPFYIGKGTGYRWCAHQHPSRKHPNRHLANIIKKSLRLGLDIPRVKLRDGLTEQDAFSTEIALISAIGRGNNGPLVNATDGGEGASNPSVDIIQRRSSALRGKPRSAETRAKISAALKGHAVSAETRVKIGIKAQAMWDNPEARLSLCKALKDRNYSPSVEVRIQVGNFHRGRKRSKETRAKLRLAAIAREIKARILRQR